MIVYGNNNHVYGLLKNSAICYFGYENAHNLTVTSDGNGSLIASVYTGNVGDTAQLTYTPNTHYGFSAYSLDGGGSIAGDTYTFGTTDGTAKAWFSAWPVRTVTVTQQTGGTVAASPTTGYDGDTVTLSNTANAEYTFGSYAVTGATLTSNKFKFDGSNVTAKGSFNQKTYTLTLQTDGHGKLVANKTTGHKNDTITLTPSYSSYYRFNNYSVTGGSVNGNTFTITANATAKANFKVNAFTATGGWEKGSNEGIINYNQDPGKTVYLTPRYAIRNASTGAIPASWYSTSNRWNPSNASAYKITLKPIMRFREAGNTNASYATTACTKVGNTIAQSQTYSGKFTNGGGYYNYSKNFTSTTQGLYALSAKLTAWGGKYTKANNFYVASGTTGSWTATGYAP
jgi:hypothetical protein